MKIRASVLLGFVLLFSVVILLLPETSTMKASRLAKSLPVQVGSWIGKPSEPGEREKKILARDTEFERMSYFDRLTNYPAIEASIVFSGKNLSQSIHRPEVCLRAQGWEFMSERQLTWENVLPNGELFPVKELICRQFAYRPNQEGELEPLILENGEKAYLWRSFYYTFLGHEKIVSGHYERTIEDIKERIFKGYDQRWAYVTFSSFITGKHDEQGLFQGDLRIFDQEQTEENMKHFLRELLPRVVSPPGEGRDASLESGKNLGS